MRSESLNRDAFLANAPSHIGGMIRVPPVIKKWRRCMYKHSAIEIRDQFFRGEQTAVSIARYYLKRIAAFDPQIGAFLKVFDEKVILQAEKIR